MGSLNDHNIHVRTICTESFLVTVYIGLWILHFDDQELQEVYKCEMPEATCVLIIASFDDRLRRKSVCFICF